MSRKKTAQPDAPYLAIKNWDKYEVAFQYKGKAVVKGDYIKSYCNKEDNIAYCKLSAFERYVWSGCLDLRRRLGHNIPNNPTWIARALNMLPTEHARVGNAIARLLEQSANDTATTCEHSFLVLSNQQIDSLTTTTSPSGSPLNPKAGLVENISSPTTTNKNGSGEPNSSSSDDRNLTPSSVDGSLNGEQGEAKIPDSKPSGKPTEPGEGKSTSLDSHVSDETLVPVRAKSPTPLSDLGSPSPSSPPPSQLEYPTKPVGGINPDRIRELVEFIQSHPDDPSYDWYVGQGHICTRSLNNSGFVQKLDNDLTPRMSSPSNAPEPTKSLKRQAFDLVWLFPDMNGSWDTLTEAEIEEVQLERKQTMSGMKYLLEQGNTYEQIKDLLHYVDAHPRWIWEFKIRDFKTGNCNQWEALCWFVDNFDTLTYAMNYEIDGYGEYWGSLGPDHKTTDDHENNGGEVASSSAASGIE